MHIHVGTSGYNFPEWIRITIGLRPPELEELVGKLRPDFLHRFQHPRLERVAIAGRSLVA